MNASLLIIGIIFGIACTIFVLNTKYEQSEAFNLVSELNLKIDDISKQNNFNTDSLNEIKSLCDKLFDVERSNLK